ncbi:hypothetical protein PUN28_019680 [Cardiocondyla obscurior]|uniref:Uncharacterized protein n=1 Tax=Cardiocondyla obscurior TaxID=286306 RepID=A0AAW2EE97_9HYME
MDIGNSSSKFKKFKKHRKDEERMSNYSEKGKNHPTPSISNASTLEKFRHTTPSHSPLPTLNPPAKVGLAYPVSPPLSNSSDLFYPPGKFLNYSPPLSPCTLPSRSFLETEEVNFLVENFEFLLGLDFPDPLPSPISSVEFFKEQQEPRRIVDHLLELLRRTCTPWTDPILEGVCSIGLDHFDPEEIRRQVSAASSDEHFFIHYLGAEFSYLAPIRLLDQVFPRSTARIVEIIEVELE